MDPCVFDELKSFLEDGTIPPGLSTVQQSNFRRKTKAFEVQDGHLYYVRNKGQPHCLKAKVLRGTEEVHSVLVDFQANSSGHCGQKKTREAISKRFYWPGMSEDIIQWVKQCTVSEASSAITKQEEEYTPIKVTSPFEIIGMDLIGNFKPTTSGNQYICLMTDYLTKWPQAYAIKSAEEVSQCILKFVYQFEAPKRILTDQGQEFVNEINKNVSKMLGIDRRLCSPYHPKTNGLVERMNGTIQTALSELVEERPDDWDNHLDAVLFGLRTKRQVTAKFSAFFLMFGREARCPSEIPEEYRVDGSVENTVSIEEQTEDILKREEAVPSSSDSPAVPSSSDSPAVPSSSDSPAVPSSSGSPKSTSSDLATRQRATAISDVKDAWEGKKVPVLLSRVGPYKLYFEDIFNTGPQREFESEVINAYLTLLVNKYNDKNTDRAYALDSFEITQIWEGREDKIKIVPQLYKFIVGIVNEGHHWMLVVILPAEERTVFLDPLGERKRSVNHCKNVTGLFMRQRGLNVSRWVCETIPHPLQQDGTSCGAYALKFAECILGGLPLDFDNSTSSVSAIREHIAVSVLQNTDDLTNLCRLCGEQDGDTDSIGCELCLRWFHRNCVNYKGRKKYICAACQ